MSTTHWLAATSSLTLLLCAPGCVEVDCGEGTIERDGTCVPSDSTPDPSTCAENTHLEDGECVADFDPTLCDDGTTEPEFDPETGITTCVGTGAGGGCEGSIVCPAPNAGNVTICGRIVDAETNAVIWVDGTSSARCDDANPETDGPCHLEIAFYDAIEFANDPQGASPLPNDEVVIDECGRFRVVNLPSPGTGFIGIGVDDHTAAANDDYALTGVAIPSSGGLQERDLDVYVVANSTDSDWTTSAGDPFGGSTFSEVGVFMPIYLNPAGDPVAGVRIDNGGPRPADEYYFTDADPDTRSTVDGSLTATGANGTGLMVNSSLSDHGGSGPAGCTWPNNLAVSLDGVVFAQEKIAEEETCM